MQLPFEQFPALSAIGTCRHAFTQRIPGVDVSHDKAEVLRRLDAAHREIRNAIGVGDWPLLTAQQIHSNKIAVADEVGSALRADRGPRGAASLPGREFAGCDGIITNQRRIALGIYVADCCAAVITRTCRSLSVKQIHDYGICTACDFGSYYSYRAEKGKTGRMLALIGLNPTIGN